ncbi:MULTISPECIES: BMC domain-containing protein [Psychrilyobacter]|uniref:BMC domain-containing protein n=1 Tax=Psychrilyobacter piezotolerans TaxID=2293438 RepID=A0ABX9KFY7_9FUSO|nr:MULTISPECIES: BMC domain-containing protein [Psychrilyobacter]MCS5422395.1 BMC domain-containing protein [Psychrilyobacter sp. S5]NDI78411.1 BMC domain-containing protein [Psychrilyobacter piezotolerans]RDE61136.1 BMC domain-containing protein [Psychrilyobacter sp. S5]REI40777.1 BMC domain-containing protein [Psychrilyobacter piezotolerans]
MGSIGVAEFFSIAEGIETLDKFLKGVDVDVYRAGTTCPGKYYFIVLGDTESINTGLNSLSNEQKKIAISGVSEDILKAIKNQNSKEIKSSIGIFEFLSISESLYSLDSVIKKTDVEIVKLVLGYGIAGKSYYVVTGNIDSIEEAIILVTKSYKVKNYRKINNPSNGILRYI